MFQVHFGLTTRLIKYHMIPQKRNFLWTFQLLNWVYPPQQLWRDGIRISIEPSASRPLRFTIQCSLELVHIFQKQKSTVPRQLVQSLGPRTPGSNFNSCASEQSICLLHGVRNFCLMFDIMRMSFHFWSSTCERVETFFHWGCGTTLGFQPWAIARKLWGWKENHNRWRTIAR